MGASAGKSKLQKYLGEHYPVSQKFTGLVNDSNICYANSVIQALINCREFKNQILQFSPFYKSDFISLQNLLKQLIQNMKGIKGRRKNILFDNDNHHDAHQFLIWVINELDQYQLKRAKFQAPNGELPKNYRTWVNKIFGGTMQSITKCCFCQKQTSRDQAFFDLSLDVSPNISLSQSLKNYSKQQMLRGSDKFFCQHCGCLQEAVRYVKIKKLPQTLIVHLKRFKYFEQHQQFIKLNHRVAFPLGIKIPGKKTVKKRVLKTSPNLSQSLGQQPDHFLLQSAKLMINQSISDMSTTSSKTEKQALIMKSMQEFGKKDTGVNIFKQNIEEKNEYVLQDDLQHFNLKSIIVHLGQGMMYGHYISLIQSNDFWVRYDDHQVTPADEEQLSVIYGYPNDDQYVSWPCAYMLFYQRSQALD